MLIDRFHAAGNLSELEQSFCSGEHGVARGGQPRKFNQVPDAWPCRLFFFFGFDVFFYFFLHTLRVVLLLSCIGLGVFGR